MPISNVISLAAGTALQVAFALQPGTVSWRLLRKPDAVFSGPADPSAAVVACQSGCYSPFLTATDYTGLTNGTVVFYQLYSSPDGLAFAADGVPVSGTPSVSYEDAAADPQDVLLERLAAGLAAEVAAGVLTPGPTSGGVIPVFTAPFVLPDKITFPLVTVHLDETRDAGRYIGEDSAFLFSDDGDVVETEGWLASYSFAVIGTSLNPDERIELRKALRRIVQANMPIWTASGMVEISFSQADSEDFDTKAAPLYLTVGRFTCQAPAGIAMAAAPIGSLSLTAFIGSDSVHG